jgi:peptide-methionine (R)-S-oxide reductase
MKEFQMAFLLLLFLGCRENQMIKDTTSMSYEVNKTEDEWKKTLSKEQYQILREKGTERAFTGKFHENKEKGKYYCAGCGNYLFSSDTKFDSGTGWPSFFTPAEDASVSKTVDKSFFMTRTEVHCSKCGGHLGHVFNDGPKPTGLRYCINSLSLSFQPD